MYSSRDILLMKRVRLSHVLLKKTACGSLPPYRTVMRRRARTHTRVGAQEPHPNRYEGIDNILLFNSRS